MHPLLLSTWRPRWMVALREWVARLLGLGAVSMAGVAPTGWPLPRRGGFAIGEAHSETMDTDDYRRLRQRTLGQDPA